MRNEHDDTDPLSVVSGLDATMEAVHTRCEHCDVVVKVIPASGTRHVIGITHEPGCPEWVDG